MYITAAGNSHESDSYQAPWRQLLSTVPKERRIYIYIYILVCYLRKNKRNLIRAAAAAAAVLYIISRAI